MKKLYLSVLIILLAVAAYASDLTAAVTPAGSGKKDGKVTLTITGGFAPYTILWTGPSGYSSSKMNPDDLGAGTYCVTVTDQYCGEAKLCVTVTEQPNSIAEVTPKKLKAYPNPFLDELYIELGVVAAGEVKLALYDVTGKIAAMTTSDVQQQIRWKLPLSLPAGTYLLHAELEDGTKQVSKVNTTSR